MGFNEAFLAVKDLVNDFKENEKAFLKSDYSEADVRNDFINKFFIALGWDVRHEQQKNPYEQFHQTKTESDKNYLERKCENLDKQIDELVYELYGFTEEEIRIVERK